MKVKVTEKQVMITEISQVNEGEHGINKCEFILPECFEGLSVTAVFNGIPVLLTDGKCYIPALKNGNCVLGVYAYRESDGETEIMYSPKPTMFFVEKGSFCNSFSKMVVPEVFDYETYCRMLQDYWRDIINSNTIAEYTENATENQYYSANATNGIFSMIAEGCFPIYNDITVSLFDGTVEEGGLYLAGTGKWYESATWYSIGPFAVEPSQKLYISAEGIPSTGCQFTRWRDEECTIFLSGTVYTPTDDCIEFTNTNSVTVYVKIGIPASVSKNTINVRYTAEIESYYELKKNINKSNVNGLEDALATINNEIVNISNSVDNIGIGTQWKDKKWVAFGTSITATNNTDAPDGTCSGKYIPYLQALTGASLTNRGVSGGRISGHILYYVHYYANEMANADLVTIEGSVNDFVGGVPLGEVGDTIPYTNADVQEQVDEYIASMGGSSEGSFAGACYQTFKIAQENAPNAVVVFITDNTGKKVTGGGNLERAATKTATGLKQSDYINMAVAVAEYMGIPVIDAGRKSLVNEEHPDFLIDHIHHTESGGRQYANTIWAQLKNIPDLIKT